MSWNYLFARTLSHSLSLPPILFAISFSGAPWTYYVYMQLSAFFMYYACHTSVHPYLALVLFLSKCRALLYQAVSENESAESDETVSVEEEEKQLHLCECVKMGKGLLWVTYRSIGDNDNDNVVDRLTCTYFDHIQCIVSLLGALAWGKKNLTALSQRHNWQGGVSALDTGKCRMPSRFVWKDSGNNQSRIRMWIAHFIIII